MSSHHLRNLILLLMHHGHLLLREILHWLHRKLSRRSHVLVSKKTRLHTHLIWNSHLIRHTHLIWKSYLIRHAHLAHLRIWLESHLRILLESHLRILLETHLRIRKVWIVQLTHLLHLLIHWRKSLIRVVILRKH